MQPLYIEPKEYFRTLVHRSGPCPLLRSSTYHLRPPSFVLDPRRALSYHDPRPYSRLRHYRDSTLDNYDFTPYPDT